jgi:mannose/fructose/N-acetylgalactosamine-specific phosphotransferase system component IID/mannose/fructose/N-acetylgalactosamine-specific phosphotransferase system component IIC
LEEEKMTVTQCLIIALLGYLSSIYSPWLALGGWYTLGRPLIAGLAVGIVLGDVTAGILLGCAVQTLFIGLVTPGGSMPADVNFAAWIGIPLAMVAGSDVNFALTLSVPLSFLGVFAVLATITFNSIFVHRQDKYIELGKLEKAVRIPVTGQITNFVLRFFPIFVCNYFGAQFVPAFVEKIPIEVIGILAAFGQLLPLIGFAILLKYVCKRTIDLIYYFTGFVLSAALGLPIVPILSFASLFAYFDYRYSSRTEPVKPVQTESGGKEDVQRLLSKKDVFSCYRSWLVWNLSVQNMERMEGPAIIRMLGVVREKLYPGDHEKQKELLARHEPFFNTEPYLGCIVPGIVLGMEEENARSEQGVPGELLTGVKTALMGPMAGIGDSLYVGTLIPILLAVAIGISSKTGSLFGPIFYIALHLGIMFPLTWFLFNRGYSMGLSAVSSILEGGIKDRFTHAMSIVGLTIVGAITSEYVKIKTSWTMMQGDELMLDVNAALNKIFPNVITLILALTTYWLMSKKKIKIGLMFLIYFVFSIVALLAGLINVQ